MTRNGARAITSLMDRIEAVSSADDLGLSVEGQRFDAAEFGLAYKIRINGFEVARSTSIPTRTTGDPQAVRIFLEHTAGGFSMSHSRTVLIPGISEYVRVVGDARKRMAFDFRLDLQKHPKECSPPVEGEIIAFLSIYSKLHPGEEVYIVLPEDGSLKSEAILTWRWEPEQSRLILAKPEGPDYPVLFTMQLGLGMVFDSFGLEFMEAYRHPTVDRPRRPISLTRRLGWAACHQLRFRIVGTIDGTVGANGRSPPTVSVRLSG